MRRGGAAAAADEGGADLLEFVNGPHEGLRCLRPFCAVSRGPGHARVGAEEKGAVRRRPHLAGDSDHRLGAGAAIGSDQIRALSGQAGGGVGRGISEGSEEAALRLLERQRGEDRDRRSELSCRAR